MKSIGLTTYGINVRDNANLEYELHNIYGKSLIDIIEESATNNYRVYEDNSSDESVFTYDEIRKEKIKNSQGQDSYDVLFLRIKTGEYGTESEIVESKTGKTAYHRGASQADVLPFGCCVMVPCGSFTGGVITFQSLGRNGITTLMKKRIDGYLRSINPNLRVVMGAIVPKVYMDRYLNDGILQSLRLIRYAIPDEMTERLGVDNGVKGMIEERVIKKPRGFIRHKIDDIRSCMLGTKRFDEIVSIENFEIDDLKLDFKLGKRSKTISMRNLDNIIAAEDITDEVDNDNGNPVFESLAEIMRETAEFYLRAKGLLLLE